MRFGVTMAAAIAIALAGAATSPPAVAAACTAADFAALVDASGASLRKYTLEMQPKLQERMRRYREVAKISAGEDAEGAALDAIHDKTLEDLDIRSSELIMKVDTLGRVPSDTEPDCSKLAEINSASDELLATVKKKSDYILARLDAKIAEASSAQGGKPKPGTPAARSEVATAKPVAGEKPAAAKPVAKETPPPSTNAWTADTRADDAFVPTPLPPTAMPPVEGAVAPPDEDGYTIDEIREATRGFFGTISTNLASVIEHAFQQSGRPTAYVLGTEGGGAFLAGLRYGKGTLYMRNLAGTRPVYWHGPSLGTDVGASGSRTMFLIYRMHQPEALFRNFTGIDGSAYFVGGVGVTLLKGGDVLMAPIRSGLGFRLGANVGYLRFTGQPTWNPF